MNKEYAADLDKLVEQTEALILAFNGFHDMYKDEVDLYGIESATYDLRGFIKDELVPLITKHEELRVGTDYPKGVLSYQQMGLKTGRGQ